MCDDVAILFAAATGVTIEVDSNDPDKVDEAILGPVCHLAESKLESAGLLHLRVPLTNGENVRREIAVDSDWPPPRGLPFEQLHHAADPALDAAGRAGPFVHRKRDIGTNGHFCAARGVGRS